MTRLTLDYSYDVDIENALQRENFSQLRKSLIKAGYPLQPVETSAPLYATLQIDPQDNQEGALIMIGMEKNLRQRNAIQLRASLKLYGHDISLTPLKTQPNALSFDCQ
jgi:hypothetical protein